jgi:GTP-binding protein
MQPDLRRARFLKSAASLADLPPDRGWEVAFAGRSNSGKSSALNAIADIGGLARVSKTPGRTRLINLFALDEQRRLVDLPGYGYARVPEAERRQWGALLEAYFTGRDCLKGLVLLMDIRHPLTDFDRQMLSFTEPLQRPVHVLLSKADKLGGNKGRQAFASVKRALAGRASVQLFSALSGEGVDAAQRLLAEWLEL